MIKPRFKNMTEATEVAQLRIEVATKLMGLQNVGWYSQTIVKSDSKGTVFGYRESEDDDFSSYMLLDQPELKYLNENGEFWGVSWYDSCIASAFEVVDKMKEMGYSVEIRTVANMKDVLGADLWSCRFIDLSDCEPVISRGIAYAALKNPLNEWEWGATDKALPVAICKSALAAMKGRATA